MKNPKLFESVALDMEGRALEHGSEITLLDLFALAEIAAIGNNPKCRSWRSETRISRAYASAVKALKEREKVMKKIEKGENDA